MSPRQGRDTIIEAGFECDILFKGDGTSFMQVKIPSTRQQYSVEIDAELRQDCTALVNEFIETVTREALELQECECEHVPELRRFRGKSSVPYENEGVEDAFWWNCGSCSECLKCHRRIRVTQFDEHAWWCINERYKPYVPPKPKPVQMGLF